MDINTVKFWVDVFQTLVTFGLGIWLYQDRRNDKTQTRITELGDRLHKRLDLHGSRLGSVEADLKHMPTPGHLLAMRQEFNKELGDVHEKVNLVNQSSSRIEGSLSILIRTVEGLNTHLRDNSR